jgi:hypothetical protein
MPWPLRDLGFVRGAWMAPLNWGSPAGGLNSAINALPDNLSLEMSPRTGLRVTRRARSTLSRFETMTIAA